MDFSLTLLVRWYEFSSKSFEQINDREDGCLLFDHLYHESIISLKSRSSGVKVEEPTVFTGKASACGSFFSQLAL